MDDNNQTTTTTRTVTTTTVTTRSGRNSPSQSFADSGYNGSATTTSSQQPGTSPQHTSPQPLLLSPHDAVQPAAHQAAQQQQVPPELRHLQIASEEHERVNGIAREEHRKAASPIAHEMPTPSPGWARREQPSTSTHQSSLANLKAAGEGLVGVRDSFRETLGTEKDRYYSKKPRARDLKNQTATPMPISPPLQQERDTADRDFALQGQLQPNEVPRQQTNWAPSDTSTENSSDRVSVNERSRRKSLSQVPTSFSPESTGTAGQGEMSTLRRLLKGKS